MNDSEIKTFKYSELLKKYCKQTKYALKCIKRIKYIYVKEWEISVKEMQIQCISVRAAFEMQKQS